MYVLLVKYFPGRTTLSQIALFDQLSRQQKQNDRRWSSGTGVRNDDIHSDSFDALKTATSNCIK